MTVLLFVSALGLQAQSAPSNQQTEEQRRRDQQASSATTPSQSTYTPSSSTSSSSSYQTPATTEEQRRKGQGASSYTPAAQSGTSNSPKSSTYSSSNQPADMQQPNQTSGSSQTSSAQTGVTSQTGSSTSTSTDVAVTAQTETEVRTVVQQIDAQGPVVVERISTEFADATCTQENARALVEALHSGTSVTLRNEDGQTATFTPTTRLGYGDAYIALSVAVQALHDAGITGCASPAQWQAVLLGGELTGGTVRTTSVTTERFPGVLVLHQQGGWTKVAQTTHVQLNQVVSQAQTNLQINNSSATAQTGSAQNQNLSEVGRPRDYNPRADANKADKDKADKSKDGKDHWDNSQKKNDEKAPDMENPPKSSDRPKY